MKTSKKISVLFLSLLFITFSCSKSDNTNTPSNPIKLLTGYSKLNISASTVEYDNEVKTVNSYDTHYAPDGSLTLFLILNQSGDFVASSVNNLNLDGVQIAAKLSGIDYTGSNFVVEDIAEGVRKLTGTLMSKSGNKDIVIKFSSAHLGSGSSIIIANGNVATINGTLGAITFNQILDLNANERGVHTLLLEDIDGSINDEVNVETGRLIREAGYTTCVDNDSKVYSGGVDLFCAGKFRKIDTGATLGVHSWCCGNSGEEAHEIPENDPQHNSQINYFKEMLGDPLGKEFYFFTINAAGADDIHVMTASEIDQYQLSTE